MPRYVYNLTVREGSQERLRQLNEQYAPALERVTKGIAGLNGIEKYLLGDQYVERIDLDGEFAEFSRQLAADDEVRMFLREVNGCFVESLRDMSARQMTCLQALPE